MTEIVVQRLRDRVEQLEGVLGVGKPQTERLREIFGLEPERSVMLGMIYAREFVTRDGCYTVLYEGRPECDWPAEKVLDGHLCAIRKSLRQYGAQVVTKSGSGWHMPPASKAIIREKLQAHQIEISAIADQIGERRQKFLDGR